MSKNLGKVFGKNEERGVYKTLDGGKTWKRMEKHIT